MSTSGAEAPIWQIAANPSSHHQGFIEAHKVDCLCSTRQSGDGESVCFGAVSSRLSEYSFP